MGRTRRRKAHRLVRPLTAALVAVVVLAVGCGGEQSDDGAADAEASITEDEATAILDEVLATFGAGQDVTPEDFAPVVDLLGEDGVWVSAGGAERDGPMAAEYLATFTNVASIERVTDGVEHEGGWGFMTLETSSGGSEYSLGFVVSRDDGGALRIEETRSLEFEALFEDRSG